MAQTQAADYAVVNPATGEVLKEYPTISDDDLKDAISRADNAFHQWTPSTTAEERAALIRRVGELHTERRQELCEIIVREMGKPIEQAVGERLAHGGRAHQRDRLAIGRRPLGLRDSIHDSADERVGRV